MPFVPPTSAHIGSFGHEWSWYLVPVSKRALCAPTPELVMHPCSHRPTSVGVLFQSVAKQGSGIRLRFNARVRGGRSVPLVGASRYYSFAAFGGGRAPAAVRRAAAGAHRLRCVAGSPALSCRCAPRRRALHPRPPHLRRGVGARRGCGLRPNAAVPRPPPPCVRCSSRRRCHWFCPAGSPSYALCALKWPFWRVWRGVGVYIAMSRGRALWLRSAPAARPAGARLRARGVPVMNKRDLPAVKLASKWRSTYPHVFHQCPPLVQKSNRQRLFFPG